MADAVSRGLAGVAVMGMLFLGWQQRGLRGQINALSDELAAVDKQLDGVSRAAVEAGPQPAVKVLPQAKVQLRKQQLRKAKGRRLKQRERARVQSEKLQNFGDFARKHGLTAQDAAAVLEELQLARETIAVVKRDVRAGEVSPDEARTEIAQIRDDLQLEIADLLGEETADALRADFIQWMGPPGGEK